MRFDSRCASSPSQAQIVDCADAGDSMKTTVSASAMSVPSRSRQVSSPMMVELSIVTKNQPS
jgi:hypothetical protein